MLFVVIYYASAGPIGGGGGGGGSQSGDITTGLIHHWPFDETSGTTAEDVVGTADCTLTNGAVFSPNEGVKSGAVFMDGENDYLNCPNPSLPTGDYTFSVLVNLPNYADVRAIYSARSDNTNGQDEIYLNILSQQFDIWQKNQNILVDSSRVEAGSWHRVTVTRAGGLVTLYIDSAATNTAYGSGTLDFSTCQLFIGADADGTTCSSSLGNYYEGYQDDFKIWNRALSTADVAFLVAKDRTEATDHSASNGLATNCVMHLAFDETSGTAADDSCASADGTLVGGAAFTTSGCAVGAACVSVDGTDDHITTLLGPPTGNFSYATWFKRSALTNLDTLFAGMVSTASSTNELYLGVVQTDDALQLSLNNANVVFNTVGTMITTTDWQHIAVTRRRSYVRVYLNGHPVGGFHELSTLNFGTCTLMIGADPDGTNCNGTLSEFFGGLLDDVWIHNRAITPAEVAALAAM